MIAELVVIFFQKPFEFLGTSNQFICIDRHPSYLVDVTQLLQLFIAHHCDVLEDSKACDQHLERDRCVAAHLDRMKVDVCQHVETIDIDALQ